MAIDRTILSSQEDPPDEADPSPTPPDEGERSWYAEAMGEEAATIPPDSGERSWYAEAMGEAPAKPVAPEPILSDPRMEMREGVDLQHPLDSQLFEELVSATPRLGAAYPALGMSPPTVRIGSGPLGVMDDDAISEFYHRSSEYQDPDSDSHIRGRAIGRMREIVGEARNAYLQEAGDNAPPEILARLNHAEMYARGQGFESARDMLEKGQAAAEASRLAKIIESGQPAPDGTIGNPFFDADLVYGRVYQPEEDVDPIPGEEIVRDWERGFRTLTRATEKVDAPQDPSLAGGLDPAQYGWEGEKGEFLKVLRDAAKAGPDSEDISEYVSNFPIGPTLDGVHDSEMLRNEIRYIEMLKHTMKRINERRVDGELTEDDANWLKSQVSRAMAIVSGRDGALSPLSSRQAAVKRVQTLVGPQHPMALEAAEKLLQSAPPPDGASADAARAVRRGTRATFLNTSQRGEIRSESLPMISRGDTPQNGSPLLGGMLTMRSFDTSTIRNLSLLSLRMKSTIRAIRRISSLPLSTFASRRIWRSSIARTTRTSGICSASGEMPPVSGCPARASRWGSLPTCMHWREQSSRSWRTALRTAPMRLPQPPM
jgi:hypothetical protein